MAAELSQNPELEVEIVAGRLGELSVEVEGKRVYSALPLPLLRPRERKILERVRSALDAGAALREHGER